MANKNEFTKAIDKIIDFGVGNLDGLQDISGADVHNSLYNSDYFIIGRYEAEEFLKEIGVFHVIGKIKDYEQDLFGSVTTDLSEPERVANMYAYIIGEQILSNIPIIQDKWDEDLTEKDIKLIQKGLESQMGKYTSDEFSEGGTISTSEVKNVLTQKVGLTDKI